MTFLIFGLAVGKIVQDVYAQAWRVDAGSLSDQWRLAVWFVVSATLMGLQVSEEAFVASLGWELLLPLWLDSEWRAGWRRDGASPFTVPETTSERTGR